jgi:predicted CoA-binding protein
MNATGMDGKFSNPAPDAIRALLSSARTVAVVGFSPKPQRASHNIARQLQRMGMRVVPVRPKLKEGLNETAYPDLAAAVAGLGPGSPIDLVNVFRAPEHVPALVDECLALGLKAIWLQDGVVDEASALRAQAAGMLVVMDRCIMHDYTRLCDSKV